LVILILREIAGQARNPFISRSQITNNRNTKIRRGVFGSERCDRVKSFLFRNNSRIYCIFAPDIKTASSTIMTNIKIEELNFIKTKGLWWVIAFGWIPVVNFFLLFFILPWKKFGLASDKINRVPFLLIFKNKKIDSTSFWGIFYLVFAGILSVGFAFVFVFALSPEYRGFWQFWLYCCRPMPGKISCGQFRRFPRR